MAFDGISRSNRPIPDEPTPWWEWATRLLGGVLFLSAYIAWLIYTTAPAVQALVASFN